MNPNIKSAAIVTGAFAALVWASEAVDSVLGGRMDGLGIEPLEAEGLSGIALAPLLHGGWDHLISNTVPMLVLGFLVLLPGVKKGIGATAVIWFLGGLGTWLLGGSGTVHIGASGLVFGWLAYLVVVGLFTRSWKQILLSVVLVVAYGSLFIGVLPGAEGVSWQSHLCGAAAGVFAAWALNRRPARTVSFV